MAENTPTALVIGGGPAGLMAAERLGAAGLAVTIADAKPSMGRKFLMAGKSGLNLTKDEPFDDLMKAYGEAAPWLRPIIQSFDGLAVQNWARDLGQPLFTGTTGRVFPEAMKASPLLRAWLARLDEYNIVRQARWRWTGWDRDEAVFETPDGVAKMHADVTVLALGGASWARLGSDGAWADILRADGVDLAAFAPANAGIFVKWSAHMRPVFGQPLKGVRFSAGPWASRGEAVLSERGLEGGGIYSVSRGVRDGADLEIDLFPDRTLQELTARLSRPRGKASLSNHLRKTLKLDGVRMALLNELARPLPQSPEALAQCLKALPVKDATLRPMDEAISTAGGVCRSALTDDLMLSARPGVFVAGEMLDWEAPTGGYLITACLATGRWAGEAAAHWARRHVV
ncbi:TIGR03862 family flavoprotein [Falsiphaeobacter marinintestinus]|uniref:TIGR03862 family flavoprotein n=1 Tax=Falsiphaeobacter marinintestinus TaxID=1492905 RepID=UPI002482B68D|nr:TIGR03862 family flavoprotein [Phaeobacter marinintestinus]